MIEYMKFWIAKEFAQFAALMGVLAAFMAIIFCVALFRAMRISWKKFWGSR